MAFTVADVRSLAPGLPVELAQIVLDEWVATGDFELAIAKMRLDPSYDAFFPGNRNDDGTLRYTEYTYLSMIDGYEREILAAGVNPDLFGDELPQLIAGGVGVPEWADRVDRVRRRVLLASDAQREAYSTLIGRPADDREILAALMSPSIDDALINRQITTAEIAAEGSLRGVELGLTSAARLVDFGFDRESGGQLAAQAQEAVPTLDVLAQRHLDPEDGFTLQAFVEAVGFGDRAQRLRVDRLLRDETSSFTRQGSVAREGAGVTGLDAQ